MKTLHCKVDKQMKIFNSVKCKDGIWISHRDTCSDHSLPSLLSQEMPHCIALVVLDTKYFFSLVSTIELYSIVVSPLSPVFSYIHFDSQKLIFSFLSCEAPLSVLNTSIQATKRPAEGGE